MITKRKAQKIVRKWMKAYGTWIIGELDVWDFHDECDELVKWFKNIKEK